MKKLFNVLLVIVLSIAMLLTFTGCSNNKENTDENSKDVASGETSGEQVQTDEKVEEQTSSTTATSGDDKFYISTIDKSLFSDYTLELTSKETGAMVQLTDSNKKTCKVLVKSNDQETIIKALQASSYATARFKDTTVAGFTAKYQDTTGNSETFGGAITYFLEKEGKIYQVNLTYYKEFSAEIANKLLETVVTNIVAK